MPDKEQQSLFSFARGRRKRRLHLRDVSETGEREYDGIGRDLKKARLEAKLELKEVAKALRIQHSYLQWIEEGESGKLPGPVYALGFIRSYAEYLEIDALDAVTRYKAESGGVDDSRRLVFPEPVQEMRMPRGPVIAISILAAATIYGGWYYVSVRDRASTNLLPPVPDRLRELVGEGLEPPEFIVSPPPVIVPAPETGEAPVSEAPEAGPDAAPPAETEVAAVESEVEVNPAPPAEVAEEAVPEEADEEFDIDQVAGLEPPGEIVTPVEIVAQDPVPDPVSDPAPEEQPPAGEPAAVPEESTAEEAPPVEEPPAVPEQEPAQVGVEQPVEVTVAADIRIAAEAPPERPAAATEQPAPEPAAAPEQTTPAPTPAPAPRQQVARVEREAEIEVPSTRQPQVYGTTNERYRVVIRAETEAWVQIQVAGAGGEVLLTRILRAGDKYQVPLRDDLVLMTGNAGALAVLVDNRLVPRLGPLGAVRRGVSLNPEMLISGTAASTP